MIEEKNGEPFPASICELMYQAVSPYLISMRLRDMGFHDAEMRSTALMCATCGTDGFNCGPSDPQFYMGVVVEGKLWSFYARENLIEEALGENYWAPESRKGIEDVIDAVCELFAAAVKAGKSRQTTHEVAEVVH